MMSDKAHSTGTPNVATTATDIYGYQDPCLMPPSLCFVGSHTKLNSGISPTGIGLSVSIIYVVNSTTGGWSAPSFINNKCDAKYTSVGAFSTSLYLHDTVSLIYHVST